MTRAGIQAFSRAKFNISGFFDGIRVFPITVTERKKALILYNIHFCLIWKSEW